MELVKYDAASNKFIVGEEALAVLRGVTAPLAVVAVCGRARQGKSYILNQLADAGGGKGFTIGPTHRPCTKGLWMWSAPLRHVGVDGSESYTVRGGRGSRTRGGGGREAALEGRQALPVFSPHAAPLALALQVLLDTEGIDAYDQVGGPAVARGRGAARRAGQACKRAPMQLSRRRAHQAPHARSGGRVGCLAMLQRCHRALRGPLSAQTGHATRPACCYAAPTRAHGHTTARLPAQRLTAASRGLRHSLRATLQGAGRTHRRTHMHAAPPHTPPPLPHPPRARAADRPVQHADLLAGGAAVLPLRVQPHGRHR